MSTKCQALRHGSAARTKALEWGQTTWYVTSSTFPRRWGSPIHQTELVPPTWPSQGENSMEHIAECQTRRGYSTKALIWLYLPLWASWGVGIIYNPHRTGEEAGAPGQPDKVVKWGRDLNASLLRGVSPVLQGTGYPICGLRRSSDFSAFPSGCLPFGTFPAN